MVSMLDTRLGSMLYFLASGRCTGDGMSKANKIQHGGRHYKCNQIQPWDFIAANNLGYFEGNIVKYVTRYQIKGGVQDLKKARHYLDKLIELRGRRTHNKRVRHG